MSITSVIMRLLQASDISYKPNNTSVTISRCHNLQTLENTKLNQICGPKEEKLGYFLKSNTDQLSMQVTLKSMTLLRRGEVACFWDGRGEEHLQKFCVQTS